MSVDQSDQKRWFALMDALTDDWVELPAEQVSRAYGEQAESAGKRVVELIRASIGEDVVSPYTASRQALMREKEQSTHRTLPETAQERRSLLAQILSGDHPWSPTATLAFRDFSSADDLSDEEIEGILEDWADLFDEDGD